ncbi:sucrase ferredoxin [Rhodococcus sp. MEB041]|uniref:sucrase ferredoxin n=1 Tax=Rhodococcus sp. MEB041 TaxID=3040323 RepID=UPI00254C741C|nr:sucrase ferredoxin [Rhodococcus sp. MEB041]
MSTTAAWRPCSDNARDRGDTLAGSGSRGERWFLVELAGSWGPSAFLDSPSVLDPVLGSALVRRIESAGFRPLAVREPGRRRGRGRWRWASVDARPGHESVHRGEVSDAADLLDVPLDGSSGIASTETIVAVCTHGRHDRCCAVRGRTILAPAVAAYPGEVWECSHLGGDRFAGTMIVLPHGLYYGNVDDADVVRILRRHHDGLVTPEFLRGRSALSGAVQVAQHAARTVLQDFAIDTLHPLSEAPGPDGRRHVLLDHHGDTVEVVLQESRSAPILTTCHARVAGPVRTHEVVSIRPSRPR